MFRPMYSKQDFIMWTLFGLICRSFLLAALLKLDITVSFFSGFHCQFIRVTEENLVL